MHQNTPKYLNKLTQKTKEVAKKREEGEMANIKVKGKVIDVKREGVTKTNGEPYKVFSLSEGFKQKDETYTHIFYNAYVGGKDTKKIEKGAIVSITGLLVPNEYMGADGKRIFASQLFVKEIVRENWKEDNEPQEKKKEEAVELPFD